MFKRIKEWFSKKDEQLSVPFELPIDEEEIFKKSRVILQQLDEYITVSEEESATLCRDLDVNLSEREIIQNKIKELNKPDSWEERSLLLKLDRKVVHGNNLRQRIELYSQNIKVYLNLMSRVEDIRVMRLHGLETEKIQNIWLEFQNSLEEYKEKIATEAVTESKESVTSSATEERLVQLRHQVFGTVPPKKEPELEEPDPRKTVKPPERYRPSLERVVLNKALSAKETSEEDFDDLDDEEWSDSVADAVEKLEE